MSETKPKMPPLLQKSKLEWTHDYKHTWRTEIEDSTFHTCPIIICVVSPKQIVETSEELDERIEEMVQLFNMGVTYLRNWADHEGNTTDGPWKYLDEEEIDYKIELYAPYMTIFHLYPVIFGHQFDVSWAFSKSEIEETSHKPQEIVSAHLSEGLLDAIHQALETDE